MSIHQHTQLDMREIMREIDLYEMKGSINNHTKCPFKRISSITKSFMHEIVRVRRNFSQQNEK